ncbi:MULTISPECIES: glycosyltransferase family 39 protein [Actinoplanes]|uniref:glycosyltransferase family 39 protein n=1 Tax=Actinoplanes TaxID=1865 RepID=UPI000696D80B|nr:MULTISPECIES: glycosyltransferase family 39 protein [Actinoplanes]GLY02209.1 hypothetical protein Acsp01_25880 [Actinoplanes sp. NBRC 101535]
MSETLTDLPSPSRNPAPENRPPRWAVWRSPADQPRWARPALLGIALVALVLYAWNLRLVDYAPLYADVVKSMSGSWRAFLYGAADPEATYTLDKLAGSFVPQVVSAKIFGYSAWSLALPQVIEGVITVLVMYRVVRRWAGAPAGLLAAGIFTLTPVTASLFGHSMPDGALVMCLVLAVDAYQRAVLEARLASLVWSGVWVGLAFQTKSLQAWLILPALAVGYLLTAPAGLGRRLRHLGVAGVVTLAVSLSWVALYELTPADDRPWISGTTDNSAVAQVFGYNGLSRLGIQIPGAAATNLRGGPPVLGESGTEGQDTQGNVGSKAHDLEQGNVGTKGQDMAGLPDTRAGEMPAGPVGPPGGDESKRESRPDPMGWTKLFDGHLGVAIAWLFPLSLLALLYGLWRRRGTDRTDPVRGGLVMWGLWLLTFGLVFTLGAVDHTAFVADLAPAVAALSALGIVMFWRAYRDGGGPGWVLPAAVAAEVAWAAWLWSHYPNFLTVAKWGAVALGVAALIVLVLGRVLRGASPALIRTGLVLGVAAMLAAPATYAVSVLDPDYSGNSFDANAGPASGGA